MTRACVVGLGRAGRVHRQLLVGMGVTVITADPVSSDLVAAHVPYVEDVPAVCAIDLWSVCTPTRDHLSTVRRILRRDPAARILVETPLCLPGEIEAFAAEEAAHPAARLMSADQYRFARVAADARTTAEGTCGRSPVRSIRMAFTDRRPDIAGDRFMGDGYGVFGYEWVHMLALLRHVLAPQTLTAYLRGPAAASLLRSPDRGTTTAWERTVLADDCELELFSTVDAPAADSRGDTPGWVRRFPSGPGGRRRVLDVSTDHGSWTVEFAPVTDPDGHGLGRDRHRVTIRSSVGTRWRIVSDSAPHTMFAWALSADGDSPPALDTLPTRRLAAVAGRYRSALELSGAPLSPGTALTPQWSRS
ncbi:hypothetical protein [Streptantibioticus silvisoli]|uniref:Gfo/Idh/MocA-like oxidoreductase N-terminal domain-containing protein n=1 Tax=Streptantibioticus silvisoli TaxID=2705255 RepID=A0ABT6VZ52_9ACTN|nr:hypothetical protein [Streptantibioticus silvisoli]MDI5963430.1 hypothetical protein [Streptantibioticus silvisoli]